MASVPEPAHPSLNPTMAEVVDSDRHEPAAGLAETSTKSYGVLKAEGTAKIFTPTWRYAFFITLAACAYFVSLDQFSSYSFEIQALATTFESHTLLATIGTIRGVFAATGQPVFAKVTDVVGRWEAYCASAFLYTIGYVICASTPTIGGYAVGQCLYQIGLTGFWLIVQIIIADNTSTRTRVFWAISPSILGSINTWVSGNFAETMIDGPGWRWGYGIFAIVVPILITPVILILGLVQRKARKSGNLDGLVAPWRAGSPASVLREIFWQIDGVGLLLLVAGFTLLLVPITIYAEIDGGWSSANVIAPFVIGFVLLVGFVVYEVRFAPQPLMPLYLFKRRTIFCGFALAIFMPAADGIAGSYLYSWYLIASGQSILSAIRLQNLSFFVEVLVVAVVGLLIAKLRYNKPFMVAGAIIQILAYGLMTRFRGPTNSIAELAWMQILRGAGYGMLIWPAQASIQAVLKHEHVAVVTAAYLCIYYIGVAIGSAVGGAIWSAILPDRLQSALGDASLAATVFGDPVTFAAENPIGTPARDAVVAAYSDAQRILLIVAVSIAVVNFLLTLGFDNLKLGDTITLPQIEQGKSIVPGEQQLHDIHQDHERSQNQSEADRASLEKKSSPV